MLNYANLNDMEFEALCRDIMERKLGVSLRRFGPGKDGGVDLTDDVVSKTIVVQVKHYQLSTPERLISNLKGELSKVRVINPRQYFICCSRVLSAANIKELFLHFQSYMSSDSHIITLNEIDDFLKQNSNRDILRKHYKLWLDDTGILQALGNDSIFIDCESFLDDIEELHKLFIRTKAFDCAQKVLDDDHSLCIIGDPGVGKTITSKMLVLYYAAIGFRVRYSTDITNLGTLKAALSRDPDAKEIILLDDCFGQAYFEMKSTQSTELISLIKYVKRHPCKKLILNSRVTIFQEAQQRQRDLVQSIERKDFKVHILDINELSLEEKAKILYNHLAFSGIPSEYFDNIRTERRYRQIIKHRNYNPRIIEFVCNPKRYQEVSPTEFFMLVKKHLDNPSELWKDEYEDRLKPEDRILLQTIYSLTTTEVDSELVRQCFERRIEGSPTIDKTIDQFSRALMRLNGGFIKIVDKGNQKVLSMQNPSVNDFLGGRLERETAERESMLASICAYDQLRLIPEKERIPYIVRLLKTGEIDQLLFSSSIEGEIVISHCLLVEGLHAEKYRSMVLDYIKERGCPAFLPKVPLPGIHNIEKLIINPEVWNYYDLTSFFEEPFYLYDFLAQGQFAESVTFIEAIDRFWEGERRELYVSQVRMYLSEAVSECLSVSADELAYYGDVASAVREASHYIMFDIDEIDSCEVDESEAASILEAFIQAEAYEQFCSNIRKLPECFRSVAPNITMYDFYVDGAENVIADYIADHPDYYKPSIDPSDDDNYSMIDAIFER